jgi:hypothetical protein
MSVRFIVQAIERRANVVAYLQTHIPQLEISWDASGKCIGGYLQVLSRAGADPFVLLEDDILITKNFLSKIQQAISQKPDQIIQFHSRCAKDQIIGSRYKSGREFYNHQCVYFPAGIAPQILHFSEQEIYKDLTSARSFSDILTQDFLHQRRLKYWVSIPSLVDHLPDVSSVDPRRSKSGLRRQARVFNNPETNGCPPALYQQWKPLLK